MAEWSKVCIFLALCVYVNLKLPPVLTLVSKWLVYSDSHQIAVLTKHHVISLARIYKRLYENSTKVKLQKKVDICGWFEPRWCSTVESRHPIRYQHAAFSFSPFSSSSSLISRCESFCDHLSSTSSSSKDLSITCSTRKFN